MRRYLGRCILVIALGAASLLVSGGKSTPAQAPPENAINQNRSGVAFMKEGLFREAAAAFRESLRADPAFNLARINLGIALFYDQDPEGASRVLSEAGDNERENPYILFTLGLVCRRKEENARAAELFERVIRIDPKCSASHYNLGLIRTREGKTGEAESALRLALELDPNQTGALYALGSLLVKMGRTEEGNRMLDRYRSLQDRIPPKAGMGSGNRYGEMGKYAIARDLRN